MEVTFTDGIAIFQIDGSAAYHTAIPQNVSSNEFVIYRTVHDFGNDTITLVARRYDGVLLNGVLTVIVTLFK